MVELVSFALEVAEWVVRLGVLDVIEPAEGLVMDLLGIVAKANCKHIAVTSNPSTISADSNPLVDNSKDPTGNIALASTVDKQVASASRVVGTVQLATASDIH